MSLRFLLFVCALPTSAAAAAQDHVALLGTYTGGGSRGIYAIRIDATSGALATPELVAELPHPEFLELHPNGRFVYALTQTKGADGKNTGALAAFALDRATGKLTPLNSASTGRGSLCHLALDGTGRVAVVASYGGAYVASFSIQDDGRVGPVASILTHEGPLGPSKPRQDAPHPHSVTMSPDSRFAFVADLGLDRVYAYQLALDTGKITAHEPAFAAIAPGAGPRHTKFSPDGKSFYVLGELDGTITACRYDPTRGALEPFQRVSTLPADFDGQNTASEIRVHPSGRFVYSANRGHQSIAVFSRDPSSGALTRIQIIPCGGEHPRNFALTPDGKWLLCAHQNTNSLAVFRVDAESGRLTATPHTASVSKPVCVLFVR